MKHSILFLVTTGILAISPIQAETVTVNSGADAQIQELSSTANFGTLPTAVSGRLGDNLGANMELRRALFRFNLTDIPPGSTVTSVKPTFHVVMAPGFPADSTFALRRVLVEWNETEVSWDNRQSGTPWQSPGASGASDVAATPSSTVFISITNSYLFPSTATLIADVQSWVDAPAGNAGWLLKSQDEVTLRTARHFGTREGLPNAIATLEVEYTPPAPAAILLTGVGLANNAIHFQFDAEAGTPYTVEYRGGINTGSWQTLTNISAQPASTPTQITDPLTRSNRIYRIRTP